MAIVKKAKRSRRGLTLIEVALVLGITAIAAVAMAQMLSSAAEVVRTRAAADKLIEIREAAKAYINTNFNDLQTLLTENGATLVSIPIGRTVSGGAVPAGVSSTTVTLPSLQGGGFLSSNFIDIDAFGHNHAFVVSNVNNSLDRIEGMVMSIGGRPVDTRLLGRIATFTGATGGFMADGAATVTGVNGGWEATPANWTIAGVGPTEGHVMASVAFNEGALVGDYLYRRDIGIAEANTMRTNLNMGGNEITNVTRVQNDAGDLELGPNVIVDGYITAGTDITALRDLFVGENATIGVDLDVGTDLGVGNDAAIGNNVTAGHDITATNNVTARQTLAGQSFADIDAAGNQNTYVDALGVTHNYVVDPSGQTNLDRLSPSYLNVDAQVYSELNSVNTNIRLFDLLPKYVARGGWIATPGQEVVPKPDCGAGTAKITLAPMRDTMNFYANISWTKSGDYITDINLSQRTGIGRRYYAIDNGALSWTVAIQGTPTYTDDWQLFAMTYCYY